MTTRPGTVSKILWHFTGGPRWDEESNKQLKERKPVRSSYNALKDIWGSRELRVGRYREVIKVSVPQRHKYDFASRKFISCEYSTVITVKSKPVCCVADIPLQHLSYHSDKYGKIAI